MKFTDREFGCSKYGNDYEKVSISHPRTLLLSNLILATCFPGTTMSGPVPLSCWVSFHLDISYEAIRLPTLLILISKISKHHRAFALFTQDSKSSAVGGRRCDWWTEISCCQRKQKGLLFHLPQQMALLALTYLEISPNQWSCQNRGKKIHWTF